MIDRLGGTVLFALLVGAALIGCARRDSSAVATPGAINTGTFPNLNIPPKPATEQLSGDQSAADIAALQASGSQSASAASIPSGQTDPAALRKLGETHAADTLKAIEQ